MEQSLSPVELNLEQILIEAVQELNQHIIQLTKRVERLEELYGTHS